ncbi:MAG: hypothetical protein DHS20C21_07770 [Gemmatimonadota bacterium]|nr:MAG: hypothetical protein DHS20C21_07770 [Gemmatimonadota bacterium]
MPLTTRRRDDVVGLAALTAVVAVATLPGIRHGMNWSDTGQIFHFGNRLLNGDFPYRDFSYQSGFLGILIDSWYQRAFGATYVSSLAARFVAQLLTMVGVYVVARTFCRVRASFAIAAGMALLTPVYFTEVLYGGGNNNYSNVMLMAGLALLLPVLQGHGDHADRPRPWRVFASGLAFAAILTARQSNGILAMAIVLTGAAFLTLRDPGRWLRPFSTPLLGGMVVGLALVAGYLAAHHALPDSIRELFANAAEKKNISALASLVNMVSGGLGANPGSARVLDLIGWPVLLAAGATLAMVGPLARTIPGSPGTRLLLLPAAVGLGLLLFQIPGTRRAALVLVNEFPRTLLTFLAVAALAFPHRTRAVTGVHAPVLALLCGATLANVWARKLSFIGQHDAPYDVLLLACVVVPLASSSLSSRTRNGVALAFLGITIGVFGVHAAKGRLGTSDGNMRDANTPLDHPMTRGILVTPEKAAAFAALQREIRPGDSLFIYGSGAPLYTLLQAVNPTRLDVTFSDAFTRSQAEEAVRALRENPPTWIIEAVNLHDAFIACDFDGSATFYGPHRQEGPRILHEGLVSTRRRYRQVFAVHHLLRKAPSEPYEWEDWDDIVNLRLHRRRE